MRAIFVGRHSAVADLEHVRIVPGAGARDRGMLRGLIEVGEYRRPVVADVVGGPPQIPNLVSVPVPLGISCHERRQALGLSYCAETGDLRR